MVHWLERSQSCLAPESFNQRKCLNTTASIFLSELDSSWIPAGSIESISKTGSKYSDFFWNGVNSTVESPRNWEVRVYLSFLFVLIFRFHLRLLVLPVPKKSFRLRIVSRSNCCATATRTLRNFQKKSMSWHPSCRLSDKWSAFIWN